MQRKRLERAVKSVLGNLSMDLGHRSKAAIKDAPIAIFAFFFESLLLSKYKTR